MPPPEAVPAVGSIAAPARRIDRFELAVLAAFAAISLWVLALDLWQVFVHGRIWTGTDGFFLTDQMQYVAWIRDASRHLLASNLFVLRPTPADYFQPALTISGGISALGVAPWLSLLVWKPIAVLWSFFAVRSYVHRSLRRLSERRAALILALFFGSFSVIYGTLGVVGDLFPSFLSWGYPFGLLALGAMLGSLLAYDRIRNSEGFGWTPALLGALASSLHPWQGELLIITLLVAELMFWRQRRPARPQLMMPAVTVLATATPLLYYAILGKADLSWGLAREASKHSFSIWTIAVAMAPLTIAAGLGYRGRPRTFLATATRAWPLAALIVYLLSQTSFSATPLHAFEGITIPLAVLAVDGIRRARWQRIPRPRLVAGLAVCAVTIPATAYELNVAPQFMAPTPGNANFITSDERRALEFLASDPDPGGVLTRFYLGSVVPARTGRRTFVGNCEWSEPECTSRSKIAQMLFNGALPASSVRAFVRSTGARFVLSDCQLPGDPTPVLAPISVSIHRFGCANVFELDSPGRPLGPLAESPLHAAVRASRRQ